MLNRELVKEALKLGFYISFAGPVTFKNSKNAQEIIKMVPNERFFIETDSPYLSPEPNRGKRNDSRNLKYIVEKIAKEKDIDIEKVALKKVTFFVFNSKDTLINSFTEHSDWIFCYICREIWQNL